MSDEYRNNLITAEQKSQDSYDKTIVSLSGGALGVSILFIKDVIGGAEPLCSHLVLVAWGLWAGSISSVILSYFFSRIALRKTIEQVDKGDFSAGVGGCASTVTAVFNILSGTLFIVGIIFLILFVKSNF